MNMVGLVVAGGIVAVGVVVYLYSKHKEEQAAKRLSLKHPELTKKVAEARTAVADAMDKLHAVAVESEAVHADIRGKSEAAHEAAPGQIKKDEDAPTQHGHSGEAPGQQKKEVK